MSYITEWASSARSSRVMALPRAYTQITQALALSSDDVPLSLHLDPSGVHVVLRLDSGALFVDVGHRIGNGPFRGIAYVTEWGAILGEIDKRWDGRTYDGRENYQEAVPPYRVRIHQGFQLAARWTPGRWVSVGQQVGAFGVSSQISIYSRSTGDEWMDIIDGFGCAAIGDDDRVVIGTHGGNVRTYAADGNAVDLRGTPRRDVAIGEAAHTVSLTNEGTVALSERAATTGVRLVDEGGVQWTLEIPFVARQPAIDGGEGRVFVAGDGLAAIDRGVVVWSTPSVVLARATAFADGTLAVCRGPGLQIVARDGSIIQQLTTIDGSTIVTPPAITPDGTIWVATSTHLCVTR